MDAALLRTSLVTTRATLLLHAHQRTELGVADEIDAIGSARSGGGGGSNERESGLMQILYEMDGFSRDDQVCSLTLFPETLKLKPP